MNKIFNISWKDIKNRFTSPSELLFYLILPLVFTFLLGGGFAKFETGEELPRLGIVDEDNSSTSAELVSLVEKSGTVNVDVFTKEDGEAALEDGAVNAALLIPIGFETQLLAGGTIELDLRIIEDNRDAEAARQAALAAGETMNRALVAAHASTAERERILAFDSSAGRGAFFVRSLANAKGAFEGLPERVVMRVPHETRAAQDIDQASASQSSAGQLVTWVFIPLLGTSVVLTYERTNGTLRRLLTTPTSKGIFLLGTYAGQLIPATVQMAILIAFGFLVMEVPWGDSVGGLVVLLLAFSLASVAFGTMLGTMMKTDSQANNLSIMSGMAMALLGGCWYPSELLPQAVQIAGKIFPTGWVMQGLNDLLLRGLGLSDILLESGILLGFALVFFVIGVGRFRFE